MGGVCMLSSLHVCISFDQKPAMGSGGREECARWQGGALLSRLLIDSVCSVPGDVVELSSQLQPSEVLWLQPGGPFGSDPPPNQSPAARVAAPLSWSLFGGRSSLAHPILRLSSTSNSAMHDSAAWYLQDRTTICDAQKCRMR